MFCTFREESPRKRRAGDSSGAKKRGRPRKAAELMQEISVIQEEPEAAGPAVVVVVSEPTQINPDPTFFTLSAVESQPASVSAPPLPVFESVQSSNFAPTPTPSVSANPTQAPSVLEPTPTEAPDEGLITVQDQTPALARDVLVMIQAPAPAAPPALDVVPPAAPNETKGEDREGQVTIEDLGPEEEEDLSFSQTKITDEGNTQNKDFQKND